MKVGTLVALIFLLASVVAQQTTPTTGLKSLVETEQAFSKAAEERSTREAFIAFIADDGVIFRPRAVAGKQWLQDHPAPASNKRPLLAWQPAYAELAEAGDLGYTTGPWEFKDDINNAQPVAYGDFVTVWKKQNDGSWRFAIDLGVTHPQSSGPLKIWQLASKPSNPSTRSVDVTATRRDLVEADKAFSVASAKTGFLSAFTARAHPNIRLYRDGSPPFVGKDEALKALSDTKLIRTWEPLGGDVSRSGDLGYSYGTYQTMNPSTSKISEQGNYLHIWKKQGGSWRLVLDVANSVVD